MKTSTFLIAAAAGATLQAGAFAAPCKGSDLVRAPKSCEDVTFTASETVTNANECSKLESIITQEAYDNVQKCIGDIQAKFSDCEADAEFAEGLNATVTLFEYIVSPDLQCAPFKIGGYCEEECTAAFNKIDTTSGASTTQASLAVGVLAGVAAYLAPKM